MHKQKKEVKLQSISFEKHVFESLLNIVGKGNVSKIVNMITDEYLQTRNVTPQNPLIQELKIRVSMLSKTLQDSRIFCENFKKKEGFMVAEIELISKQIKQLKKTSKNI